MKLPCTKPAAGATRAQATAGWLALVVLACAALPAQAQTQWKWRAADGRVIYSDRPPPSDVAEKDILGRPSGARRYLSSAPALVPVETAGAPAIKASDPQLEARKREADQAEKARQKAEEERVARQKAENCTRARSYAKSLEDGIRIARSNEKGENEILSDAARAQELARAQQVIAADCAR
jgi:hypothetical protein